MLCSGSNAFNQISGATPSTYESLPELMYPTLKPISTPTNSSIVKPNSQLPLSTEIKFLSCGSNLTAIVTTDGNKSSTDNLFIWGSGLNADTR